MKTAKPVILHLEMEKEIGHMQKTFCQENMTNLGPDGSFGGRPYCISTFGAFSGTRRAQIVNKVWREYQTTPNSQLYSSEYFEMWHGKMAQQRPLERSP